MKIHMANILNFMVRYIENDYNINPLGWYVDSLLSSINMLDGLFDTDSPTADPAYWYDWKELIEEELANDNSIVDEENGLTPEQGLVAVQFFLHHRYWVKDNDMLLKDAHADLIREYNASKDNLESSQLWQEWLVAISEGRKFDKLFSGEPR